MTGLYAGFSAVGLGNTIRKRRRTVRLALAIALCEDFLQAFGRNFFIQWSGGLPRLEEEAWAEKRVSVMPFVQRLACVPGCQSGR